MLFSDAFPPACDVLSFLEDFSEDPRLTHLREAEGLDLDAAIAGEVVLPPRWIVTVVVEPSRITNDEMFRAVDRIAERRRALSDAEDAVRVEDDVHAEPLGAVRCKECGFQFHPACNVCIAGGRT